MSGTELNGRVVLTTVVGRTVLMEFIGGAALLLRWNSCLAVSYSEPDSGGTRKMLSHRTFMSNYTTNEMTLCATEVTGQLADKPTRGQSSRGLVSSRTSQLAEMFDLKYGVYNSSKCYFRQITLFIRCQYSIGLELGVRDRFNVQIKYSNSTIFKNSLSAS